MVNNSRLIKRFLLKEGFYQEFVNNFDESYARGYLRRNDIMSLQQFMTLPICNFICMAFNWKETKQGYYFWKNVANKAEMFAYRYKLQQEKQWHKII